MNGRTFRDGWRGFWRVFDGPAPYTLGFFLALLVWDVVTDVLFFVCREIWRLL